MNVRLMHRGRDFVPDSTSVANAGELARDVELETLVESMSGNDEFLLHVVRHALLMGLDEPRAIVYRQEVLRDCLRNQGVIKEIYDIAVTAQQREKEVWGWPSTRYPEGVVYRSRELLQIFLGLLRRLRSIAIEQETSFSSEGFRQFFSMVSRELDDDYLRSIGDHLRLLSFRRGVLMSAELGAGVRGDDYILLMTPPVPDNWLDRALKRWREFGSNDRPVYTYDVDGRDEAGSRALSQLKSRGLAPVATALAQSADHILGFFDLLRLELGFYIGCVNLHERMTKRGPLSFPMPLPVTDETCRAEGLYDICLSLRSRGEVVRNNLQADGKRLVIITGANRGGKSTFLRSIGLAQMMMQAGMFVAADSFTAGVCPHIFTHFKRQEDASMKRGKLDEELNRLSWIVDRATTYSMILMNESLASTNEREGAAIAHQVLTAFRDMHIRVLYVTHIYELARELEEADMDSILFLRADRDVKGQRSFRILPGKPLPTSYGMDLYDQIFDGNVH